MKSKELPEFPESGQRVLSPILKECAKNLPLLADNLIENNWNAGALFTDAVAESIRQRVGLVCEMPDGKTLSFKKYEVLGTDGLRLMLKPYELDSLFLHAPLMDHLEEDMLERLREVSDRYEAAWQKLIFAFKANLPDDAALCDELKACRTELHNVVADLYLGERTPVLDADYTQPYVRLTQLVATLRTHLEEGERSILP